MKLIKMNKQELEEDYLDSYDVSDRSKLAIIFFAFLCVMGIMALAGFGVFIISQVINLFAK